MTPSTYKTKVMLPRKRRAYQELFVVLFFAVMAISNIPYIESYDRQTYLKAEYNKTHSCAFWECPKYIQDQIVEGANGLYPPDYYERDSKDWWHSFCTYAPDLCK